MGKGGEEKNEQKKYFFRVRARIGRSGSFFDA
jgi:hypothetical protein